MARGVSGGVEGLRSEAQEGPESSKLRSDVGLQPVEMGPLRERRQRRGEEAVAFFGSDGLRAGSIQQAGWTGCGASIQVPVPRVHLLREALEPPARMKIRAPTSRVS